MEVQRHIGYEIRETDNYIRRFFDRKQNEMGFEKLTFAQTGILHYLFGRRDTDIYQKDLEKQFGLCRSSVTNTIQVMEKKGYLQREVVEQDARLKKVVLTEKGMKHHEMMKSIVDGLNEKTLQGITDDELESFFRVIDKLEANLIQQKEERQYRKE